MMGPRSDDGVVSYLEEARSVKQVARAIEVREEARRSGSAGLEVASSDLA